MQSSTTTIAQMPVSRIFWSLIIFILILVGLYSYFVSKSIVNIIVRKDIEQELLAVGSRLSSLEFEYLSKKEAINLDLAYTLGFSDVKDKNFVTRKSLLGKRLTLNNEI